MRRAAILAAIIGAALTVQAAELHLPAQVTAANPLTITTSGSGQGKLIIAGPASVSKRKVDLGSAVTVNGSELQKAGRYIAVLKTPDGNASATFFVVAARPANIAFLAQPSRVPTARNDVVSGTAFVMDKYDNLVITPTPVKFELAVPGTTAVTRTAESKDGVAWVRLDSGKREGAAQFVASTGDVEVKRVVQQVAGEPCNLRIHAQPDKNSIVVQTDPVRDCSGNAVPDGTIVTFTQVDATGKSTVDARIKKGIAKAELPGAKAATISVASGVVVGNEIKWRGGE